MRIIVDINIDEWFPFKQVILIVKNFFIENYMISIFGDRKNFFFHFFIINFTLILKIIVREHKLRFRPGQ